MVATRVDPDRLRSYRMSPDEVLNARTRTLLAKIDNPNPGSKLRPGLDAYATVIVDEHLGMLAIPATALSQGKEGASCGIVAGGKAASRAIVTGSARARSPRSSWQRPGRHPPSSPRRPTDTAWSRSPVQAIRPSDLAGTLRLAGARDLDIALARERVCQTLAELEQARVLWLPSLSIGPSWIRHDGPVQNIRGRIHTVRKSSLSLGSTAAAGSSVSGPVPAGGPAQISRLTSFLRISDAISAPSRPTGRSMPGGPGSRSPPTTPGSGWPRRASTSSRPPGGRRSPKKRSRTPTPWRAWPAPTPGAAPAWRPTTAAAWPSGAAAGASRRPRGSWRSPPPNWSASSASTPAGGGPGGSARGRDPPDRRGLPDRRADRAGPADSPRAGRGAGAGPGHAGAAEAGATAAVRPRPGAPLLGGGFGGGPIGFFGNFAARSDADVNLY